MGQIQPKKFYNRLPHIESRRLASIQNDILENVIHTHTYMNMKSTVEYKIRTIPIPKLPITDIGKKWCLSVSYNKEIPDMYIPLCIFNSTLAQF